MKKSSAPEIVVYDPSSSYRPKASKYERPEQPNFMKSNIAGMYHKSTSGKHMNHSDDTNVDIRKLLRDVEYFGATTWREKKRVQDKRAVELGGMPIKKHRTPLSVAIPAMKNKKKRDQKKADEELLLGMYSKLASTKEGKAQQKRRPEDRALMTTEGRFKNGTLNVKHLLVPEPPKRVETLPPAMKLRKGRKGGKGKGKGKKNRKGRSKGRQ